MVVEMQTNRQKKNFIEQTYSPAKIALLVAMC